METLTAGNFTSLFIWKLWCEPWKIKALQKWMLVVLLEPACKCCWTRWLGGERGQFQAAWKPKMAIKEAHWDDAMKDRTLTTGGKWPKETTWSKRGSERGEQRTFRAQRRQWQVCSSSCFPHKITTHLPSQPDSSTWQDHHLEAIEGFHILQSTYEPLMLYIFSTGESDLLRRFHNHYSKSFCTTWLSRLNTGSSASLFAVVHKPLYIHLNQHHHIIWPKMISTP